jgi:cell division protease FtsH
VHKISIVPRGMGALGYTMQRPAEDRHLVTQSQLEARLAVLLGGRAAEELVFGHRSTGAADDLARATEMARAMAARYGMVPGLGAVSYDGGQEGMLGLPGSRREHAPETSREVDLAVREILDRAHARALSILERNRDVLDDGARTLLARETLDAADVLALAGRLRPAPVLGPRSRAA